MGKASRREPGMVGNMFPLVHLSVQKFEVHRPDVEIKKITDQIWEKENISLDLNGSVYFCHRTSFLCLHGVYCSLI